MQRRFQIVSPSRRLFASESTVDRFPAIQTDSRLIHTSGNTAINLIPVKRLQHTSLSQTV